MKKLIALAAAAVLACSAGTLSLADGTGVQMIGGPAAQEDAVSLDDFRIAQTAHIEGIGDVTLLKAEWLDEFSNEYGGHYRSGEEAQYLRLTVRILNTTYEKKNYLPLIDNIICDYGNGYQFAGWKRQMHKDTDDARVYMEENDSYDIESLYAGRYAIVVTLPNICVDSKEPLSVSFTIGSSKFTFNERR